MIIPPCINNYYILDLSEHNSSVRYCLKKGNNVFIISWRNPDEALGDKTWDDYLKEGTFPAINAVKKITGAKKINGAPWKTTFISTEVLKCPMEFVLGASGHIAGVIKTSHAGTGRQIACKSRHRSAESL